MHTQTAAMVLSALVVSCGVAVAQTAAAPSGHWEGTIQIPNQELQIQVDLARTGDRWDGTITIPAQNVKGFPLSEVSVQAAAVSFEMNGIPGTPSFKGRLSDDAKTLSGDFSQGGATFPFSLTRAGEANIEPLPKSTPISKEMEGSWEATLDADGTRLRLTLKLSNTTEGPATGTIVSVDQGGAVVPIASVVQAGTHLTLLLPTIAGTFDGELEEGQLVGTWTQGPRTRPLVFSRPK